jgi:D-alanyl-D-alanine carboxypeptidase/D-alanyl-D-alanine-endopeptidase (penicillin-binding protein 4)
MRRLVFGIAALLLVMGGTSAQPRKRTAAGGSAATRTRTTLAVNQLAARHSGMNLGAWGAYVLNLTTGQVLLNKDANHHFLPASNAKLFATAYALSKLGPEYRFVTRVVANEKPDAEGTVSGDLSVIGSGDPTISGRQYPNQASFDDIPDLLGDPMGPIDAMIRQMQDAGVRRIKGDIVGDDRAYVWEPYPAGWAENDTLNSDGAPVSALMFADNRIVVTLRGGAVGEPAALSVVPETGYFTITSHVRSGAQTRVQERREPGSRQVELRGEVRRGDEVQLAVDDPARYFAHVLRERLLERGIAVDGVARARHRFDRESQAADRDYGYEVARRLSPPLANIVRLVNKASQNLHAEILLREAAREPGKAVSRTGALTGLREFLGPMGINGAEVDLSDGSGLSRLDLVTPEAVVKLLRAMSKSEHGAIWTSSLPVAGADGTLKDRFAPMQDRPEMGRVMAKTGTLRHVTALSGYVQTQDRQLLAFSVFTNNMNASSADMRAFVDDLVLLFVK